MRFLLHPIALAALLTLLNAAKPPVVDDTAYLLFARNAALNPLDPYGYELFWYTAPEPAFGILATPVLPYWLAAGTVLFGENWVLLKLWLFPFAAVLAFSVRGLGRRYASDAGPWPVPAVVLGPGVLPFFNLMLDVPTLALELAAVAVFVRGGWRDAVFAGLLAGLAMQTKYSAFVTPAILVWYGLTHRQYARPAAAAAVAVAVFAAWELFLVRVYGESHFLHHAANKSGSLGEKTAFLLPLLGQFGAAAGWAGYAGWTALRFPGIRTSAVTAAVLLTVLCTAPFSVGELRSGGVTANGVLFTAIGGSALAAAAACSRPWTRDSVFLLGWLAAEAAGAVVLSPFPAGRRLLAVAFVAVLLVARRLGLEFRFWAAVAVVCGLILAALDTADAWVEPAVAARAAEYVAPGSPTYFVGHWGFQHACDRRGWTPLVPGKELLPGDTLLLPAPVKPGESFFRPLVMNLITPPAGGAAEVVAVITADDPVPVLTLPNLYTGGTPVGRRTGPRMVVRVYRVLKPWRPIPGP